jgi:hypothetical protein
MQALNIEQVNIGQQRALLDLELSDGESLMSLALHKFDDKAKKEGEEEEEEGTSSTSSPLVQILLKHGASQILQLGESVNPSTQRDDDDDDGGGGVKWGRKLTLILSVLVMLFLVVGGMIGALDTMHGIISVKWYRNKTIAVGLF